jgi:hypothetical protein
MIIVVQLSHKVGLFTCKQIGEFWCSSGKTVIPARRGAALVAAERIGPIVDCITL